MSRGGQISRQWQILQILEVRKAGVSVPDLAGELESNVRTVYRDMEALESAGFPIYSEKEDGVERWKFVEGYRVRMPIPLELTEIMALAIARDHLKAFEGTVFSASLQHAFEKIQATLKPEAHVFLDGLSESFRVGIAGKRDYRKHRETVDIINKAVLEHRTVVIQYRSMNREGNQRQRRVEGKAPTALPVEGATRAPMIDRKIDPYHVWFMGGTIYVIAFSHERQEMRLFVLDRIAKARLTEDRFEIREDFSLDDFLKGRFRVMDGERTDVRILFDASVAPYVKERTWHPSQRIEEQKNGSVMLSMSVEGLAEVRSWVLSFGSHAEVLKPSGFRKEVAEEIGLATRNYLSQT